MDEKNWLAERFESQRARLSAVAYRMLGSRTEADDALQEAWVRLSRSDTSEVENLAGWLTTVVARVCLDVLRSRKARSETALDESAAETAADEAAIDPEQEVLLADSVGPALMVVLEALAPAERVAFVLHDLFAVSFDEIAGILGRSPVAARQLASRGRRRVQGAGTGAETDRARQRQIVSAFLAASRNGDFDSLLAVLDPEILLRADTTALRLGASTMGLSGEVHGASAVANVFNGRARAAQPALVNGEPGAVWMPGGKLRAAFQFRIAGDRIVEIHVVADPSTLDGLDVALLGRNSSTESA